MDIRRVEIQPRHLPPSDAIKETARRLFNKLNGLSYSIEEYSVRLASEKAEPLYDGPYFVYVEMEM